MISYLKGQILHKDATSLILQINSVGYLIYSPKNIIGQVQIKDEMEFFIHTHVREDILALYGFLNLSELKFFKLLLTVSGIGPKSALEIIGHSVEVISSAIFAQDVGRLTKIPGLGKKTAERLILELKNKIDPDLTAGLKNGKVLPPATQDDVMAALLSLGYSRQHISAILPTLDPSLSKPEDIVRHFLKNV